MTDYYKVDFCISPHYLETNSENIVASSIFHAMKKLYSDGVLTLDPYNIVFLNHRGQVTSSNEEIDYVSIIFQDTGKRLFQK